jgi:DNA-binding IclR family transcriptional regulator
VAAPIRNAAGRVFAAISVSGPPERMTAERQLQLASVVIDTAGAIYRGGAGGRSSELGVVHGDVPSV